MIVECLRVTRMLHSFFGEEAMKLKCTDAINRPSVPAYCRKDCGPRVEPCLCDAASKGRWLQSRWLGILMAAAKNNIHSCFYDAADKVSSSYSPLHRWRTTNLSSKLVISATGKKPCKITPVEITFSRFWPFAWFDLFDWQMKSIKS